MCIRYLPTALVILAATQAASAQTVISPANVNPYSRSSLSPYINFNFSRGGDYDFRNPLVRPILVVPDFVGDYDPTRPFAGRGDFGYQQGGYEAWIKMRESETRLSPSGQPIGFMIWGPYYDLPNQNSFVPSAPNRGRLYR